MNNELNNVNAFQCKVCMVWLSVWQFDPWSWFCVKFGDHVQENRGSIKIRWAPFILEITISSRAKKRHVNIFWQIWQTSLKMQARHRHKDTQSIFSDLPGAANSFGMRRKTKHNVEVPCGCHGCHGCHINLWFARHANCQKQTPHKNSETLSTKCLEFWTPRWRRVLSWYHGSLALSAAVHVCFAQTMPRQTQWNKITLYIMCCLNATLLS